MSIELKDQDFEKEVLQASGPVLVDFWAPWCGPCKMLRPVVEELGEKYAGKIKILELNVDENPVSSGNYEILSIPALKFFKDGKVVDEMVGLQPREVLEEKIKSIINQ